MKVFMSWSGSRSMAAAELLQGWIKCVLQATQPWISTSGIDPGAVWFNRISDELKDTSVGIVCLTHQNKNSPWILFEAGALAKGLTATQVCTFLVDLGPSDITDPLAQFNHTSPDRAGLHKLVVSLNAALTSPLPAITLNTVFDAFWPEFESKFAELLAKHPQIVAVKARPNDELLEEILQTTRNMEKRLRLIEAPNMLTTQEVFGLPAVTGANAKALIDIMINDSQPIHEIMFKCRALGVPPAISRNILVNAGYDLSKLKGEKGSHTLPDVDFP
jgi:hypothetical protein